MKHKKFIKKVWLSSPTMHGEEQKFVQEAFDTNWISTVGANLIGLERILSEYIGCKYAVALSAGTAALHLAAKLAGVKKGERVFCSDMTFIATVNPVVYEGGEQIFIDCERETWNLDPQALEKAFELYPETKIVMVANLYGTPAKLDEIQAICKEYGAYLIEDAAESLGATFRGVQTGTFGNANVISFNGNKIITTSGGGAFLTNCKEDAEKVRFWSTQARENAPWYQHNEIGYNYRMSNVLAGIGRGQMMHLNEHRKLKKKIYLRYQQGLKDLPISMNPYLPYTEPNFWLSCILIDKASKVTPDIVREHLAGYNVESRPIWKPMHMQPLYLNHKFVKTEESAVDEDIFARGLCLPSDIKMTEEVQDIIIDMIKECFSKEK